MRREFVEGLIDLATLDERVVLLTADLGFGTIEPFVERFPERFFNVGVAEQGMVSVATGLAREGFHPYCYSIATFAVGRTWEFLRNGPVAHGLTMGLVGIGPGFDYGVDGHTHHALEDVGLLRLLPRARILCPADASTARTLGAGTLEDGRLTYFRLARGGSPCKIPRLVAMESSNFAPDIMIVALGDAWPWANSLHEEIATRGLDADVCVVEELGTKESEDGLKVLRNRKAVITIESHLTRGGLASAVADQLSQVGWKGRLLPVGANDLAMERLGSSEYLWKRFTQSHDQIVRWCEESVHGG